MPSRMIDRVPDKLELTPVQALHGRLDSLEAAKLGGWCSVLIKESGSSTLYIYVRTKPVLSLPTHTYQTISVYKTAIGKSAFSTWIPNRNSHLNQLWTNKLISLWLEAALRACCRHC